jgi:two-component system sensor histidine kinase YesM
MNGSFGEMPESKLYRNHIKHKLFNELFLIYSAIFMIAILLLAWVVSENISLSLQKKEWTTNEQVVVRVYKDLDKNLNVSDHISRQLILNPSFRAGLTDLVSNGYHPKAEYLPLVATSPEMETPIKSSNPKITANPTGVTNSPGSESPAPTDIPVPDDDYEQYFHTLLLNHREILSIGVYSPILNQTYRFTRGPKPNKPNLMVDQGIPSQYSGWKLIPGHPAVYLPGKTAPYVYSINYDIGDGVHPNSRNIGKLTIDYDIAATSRSYAKYLDDFHGSVLILTTDGEVIYDSSAKYYGHKYPYFKKLKNTRFGRKLDVRSIISVNDYEDAGVVVAAMTPNTFVAGNTVQTRWTIYLLASACIITVLLLTFFTIITFSRRIGLVMEGLKKVRDGDLSARIPITGKRDEISEIAASFNIMCDEINHYIQRVYVSEINQKTAELKALQAQINPHFLYNTLEAIRMRAVSKGVHEVGDMIYLLSELFRNSIKGEMIVTLDEELNHTRMYLELFNMRYLDKLTVYYDIASDTTGYAIIKHTLQPIIENYVKHGIDIEREDNRLNITINRYHQDILITVADNGHGIDPAKLAAIQASLSGFQSSSPILPASSSGATPTTSGGLGLVNVNERIKIIYGPEYGIDISNNSSQGVVVTLKIPAKTREELREHV